MISLLTLLDDIATTLDDVAVMTKTAITKTSALMSDDLAVNSAVVDGADPDRELPIVKAIFVGSLLNKVYCIVGVLALLATYPAALKVVLFAGGIYLSYEGAHKVLEKLFHKKSQEKKEDVPEKKRIQGAVRTDLILSIEIIVIANSSIKGDFWDKTITLIVVGFLASVIIYGLVAILVKIDDLGLYLIRKDFKKTGLSLVRAMPYAMKTLGIVGTLAMFLVGGGIISHTFHLPVYTMELLQNLVTGLLAGLLSVGILAGIMKMMPTQSAQA